MKEPIIHSINGATVALYPMKEVEAVTVIARFHAGSWYEGKQWGAHHLLEHVMLDGGEKYRSEDEIELFKEENGLSTNGITGGRYLEFWVRTPASQIKEALSLLFDTVFNPLLNESDIAREKTIIAQEYRDKWSNPQTRFGREATKNLFGKTHPYMRDGMGDILFVENISKETLHSIHTQFCVTKNLTIVAVGNFDTSTFTKLLDASLSDIPQGETQKTKISKIKTSDPYYFGKEDVLKVTIGIDWVSQKLNEDMSMKDKIATNLATYVLGGSSRSRLNKELRTKRGWVYSASAGRSLFPNISGLWVHTSTDPEKIDEVYKILLSLTHEFAEKGMTDEEFNRARNFINMQRMIAFDSVGSIADKIMNDVFHDKTVYMPEEMVSLSHSIKKNEVTQFIREYLTNTPVVSVMAKTDPKLKIA